MEALDPFGYFSVSFIVLYPVVVYLWYTAFPYALLPSPNVQYQEDGVPLAEPTNLKFVDRVPTLG